jgi:hypothetical protein
VQGTGGGGHRVPRFALKTETWGLMVKGQKKIR